MRKILLLLTVIVLSAAAIAQESASKLDVFGGYSYFKNVRVPHCTPYAHALFGVDRFHATVVGGSGSDSAFATALGGGVDIPVKGIFAIRAAQLDWLRTNHFNASQNNMRLSTGVVFRFGE